MITVHRRPQCRTDHYAWISQGNYRLSDPEVFRLHQRRVETRSHLIADATSLLERTAPGHESLRAVVAEPLSSNDGFSGRTECPLRLE